MKIRSYIGVGIRCSHCGSFQKKHINVFDGGGTDERSVVCSQCKRTVLEVVRAGKSYRFEAYCAVCGDRHKFSVPVSEALHTSAKKLMCPVTRVAALVLGRDEFIDRFAEDESEIETARNDEKNEAAAIFETISAAGGAFCDAIEFFECLEHFKKLSASGKISCQCGDGLMQLQVEEDGFRIICSACGREKFFDFCEREEIEKILNTSEIFLT